MKSDQMPSSVRTSNPTRIYQRGGRNCLTLILTGMLIPAATLSGVAQTELFIAPAVEIAWPSLPNKLYQVMGSDSLSAPVWSEVGAPAVGTGALVRTVLLSGDAKHRFFRVQELAGTVTNWLEGLSEMDLRPAKITTQAGGLLAEGVRAVAAGITRDDLLTARFQFDMGSQSLRLINYRVSRDVGVFYDYFFAKDVAPSIVGRTGRMQLSDRTFNSLTGTNMAIELPLQTGHVLNYAVLNQTQEHSVELLAPDGQRIHYSIHGAKAGFIHEGYPVLESGTYLLRIRPRSSSPTQPMSCDVFFVNNNFTALSDIKHGSSISALLRSYTYDYAKYKIRMTRGQTLRLPAPNSSSIGLFILNSLSEKQTDQRGLPLIFEAPEDGYYYLFVYCVTPGTRDLSYTVVVNLDN